MSARELSLPLPATTAVQDAAWVTVELPLPAASAFEFATNVERLLRLNPYLQFENWEEDPGPFVPGKRYRLHALNEMTGLPLDVALTLESVRHPSRFLLRQEPGLKRALEVSVEPRGAGSALTLKEHYHRPAGPDREERLREVDHSLTPWGISLRRHVLGLDRWGWFGPYRWYRERFWLGMRPRERRVARLVIWTTVLEFVVFLFVFAIYWNEHLRP